MVGPTECKELLFSEVHLNRPDVKEKLKNGTVRIWDGCYKYELCLQLAIGNGWDGFTCKSCSKFKGRTNGKRTKRKNG